MICPNCNSEVPEGVKFCTTCGVPLPSPAGETVQRYCVRCGKPCEEGKNLCRECRAKKAAAKAAAAAGTPVKKSKKKKSSPIPFLIAIIVILALFCAFGAWFLFGHSIADNSTAAAETSSDSADNAADSSGYTRVKEDTSAQDSADAAAAAEAEAEQEEEPEEAAYVSTYEVVAGDVSWKEAKAACEEKGGHLATITSEEEYETICKLADDSGLTYLWLGSHINDASQDFTWDDGEEWSFEKWYPDEPSKADTDGTPEYCLCLWNAKHDGEDIGWTFNDQRSDVVSAFASVSGHIGYICEIEVPES